MRDTSKTDDDDELLEELLVLPKAHNETQMGLLTEGLEERRDAISPAGHECAVDELSAAGSENVVEGSDRSEGEASQGTEDISLSLEAQELLRRREDLLRELQIGYVPPMLLRQSKRT